MEFLEVPLFDDDLYKLIVRLLFNLGFVALIIFAAYYPRNGNRNYVFSFMLMNLMVFFICFTLKKLDIELGMALGLFAIFSIIRYRTDQIRVKEMTYLFIVIGIAVINALSNKKTSYAELLFANLCIFSITLLFEKTFLLRRPKRKSQDLVYDNVAMLAPEQRESLIADLYQRTGLRVNSVKVQKLDLAKGTGNLVLYLEDEAE